MPQTGEEKQNPRRPSRTVRSNIQQKLSFFTLSFETNKYRCYVSETKTFLFRRPQSERVKSL